MNYSHPSEIANYVLAVVNELEKTRAELKELQKKVDGLSDYLNRDPYAGLPENS